MGVFIEIGQLGPLSEIRVYVSQ